MKVKELPEYNRLIELFDYNYYTGILTWKSRKLNDFKTKRDCNAWNTRYSNTSAGCINKSDGYLQLSIDTISYRVHRLIWKHVTGNGPIDEIDHINHNRVDNRFDNLREATRKENSYNIGLRKDNVSGIKGVSYITRDKRYMASLCINGKTKNLGYFKTKEEAEVVVIKERDKLHGEFSCKCS